MRPHEIPFVSAEVPTTYENEHGELSEQELKQAQEIAGLGNYDIIREKLAHEGLLAKQAEILKHEYQSHIESKGLHMTQGDWEMFAIINLYDKITFEHSLRTFNIAHEMTASPLTNPHGIDIDLAKLMKTEGVNHEEFLRAAMFHDIGKVTVPREILNDKNDQSQLNTILLRMLHEGNYPEIQKRLGIENNESVTLEEIVAALEQVKLRPFHVVPVCEIYPTKDNPNLFGAASESEIEILKKRTLFDYLKVHEKASEEILASMGLEIEAVVAGQHHNYGKEEMNQYTISTETLQICSVPDNCPLAQLLAMADISDALRSPDRSYKKGDSKSELEILAELIFDANRDHLNKALVYLWISNKYPEHKATYENKTDLTQDQKDREEVSIQKIETFFESLRENIEQYRGKIEK